MHDAPVEFGKAPSWRSASLQLSLVGGDSGVGAVPPEGLRSIIYISIMSENANQIDNMDAQSETSMDAQSETNMDAQSETTAVASQSQSGNDHTLDNTGYCLLSLDGGGVRGLSTLYILQGIMHRLNLMRKEAGLGPRKPCEMFDLIGGTSTGG